MQDIKGINISKELEHDERVSGEEDVVHWQVSDVLTRCDRHPHVLQALLQNYPREEV